MKKKKKLSNIDLQARRERIENAKTIGMSLFSNQSAIDAGTHNPWWAALIVFLVASFVPMIPILSGGFTRKGYDIIAPKDHDFARTGTQFLLEIEKQGVDLTVNGDHKLMDYKTIDEDTVVENTWKEKYTYGSDLQYYHVNEETHQIDLAVYYTSLHGENFSDFKNKRFTDDSYEVGTAVRYEEDKDTKPKAAPADDAKPEGETEKPEGETEKPAPKSFYRPDTIVIGQDGLEIRFFKQNSTLEVAGANKFYDYKNFEPGYNLVNLVNVEGEIKDINSVKYCNGVLNNWMHFFNDGYLTARNNQVMIESLTALAIFVGLGFFMGLMIFILTRGKRNINRRLTFLMCQKIQAWAMVSPAILAMIMGFIIPGGAQGSLMFFVIFLGVRIMWMSMKQLRPVIR